ncbi:DNA-binding helix-turn-helix protein [Lentilactobacillus parafarraginis DSM 18390 = JCM 14109]|uniref:DNA-binding helix-turn-helix protein n=2 Tax=Lentilactobacillus parafarraginis TaxID=390842 RepID=A0A0R1YDQ3_9LACO|nr:DNA-binding helix-turn-helix protein [Lentilactobacillus parafarraginis DSM 18390 = JCM 14109]
MTSLMDQIICHMLRRIKMNNIHFAQKLKKARSDLAITQQQLADKLHVSRKTVSGWETGRTRPDIDMLRQMADIYHISLDELVSDAKAPEHHSDSIHREKGLITRVTTTTLDIILAILIVQRFTHNSRYDNVFLMMDYLIYFGFGLRLLLTRWVLKILHSVRSPIFLICYFLFGAFSICAAFSNLFNMGFAFQLTIGIIGLAGLVNLIAIGLLKPNGKNDNRV